MTSREELACVYSSLILFDDDISITAEKLQTILKTANVEIEPYWPTLFAKALEGVDIKGLITNISSGVGSGAPAAGGAAPAAGGAAEKKEEKKEEKAEESEEDDDMGFGLFD